MYLHNSCDTRSPFLSGGNAGFNSIFLFLHCLIKVFTIYPGLNWKKTDTCLFNNISAKPNVNNSPGFEIYSMIFPSAIKR